jgi:ribosomal protein S18 acetylase RimI-like enzyme
MGSTAKKHYDIDIKDLSETYLDAVARLHALCFPAKIETLLGHDCLIDVLRERFLGPRRDSYCRIAVLKSDGKLAAYLYATPLGGKEAYSHAFINPRVLKAHLVRKVWLRPRVWGYMLRRFWNKRFKPLRNEGDAQAVHPHTEVAKMLAIDPDCRGGNVGVDLMLDQEREAAKRGARRVCGLIERNNIKAEKLYASIGWVRTSPDSDRYDIFAMHKDIEPSSPAG